MNPSDRAESLAMRIAEMRAEVKPGHLDECENQWQRDLHWWLIGTARDLESAERGMQIIAEMHREREG